MRDKKKSEPISKKMKDGDFHEHQVALHCGLHAIHNLFREDSWPTVEEMNKEAIECAKESGDKIYNHKSVIFNVFTSSWGTQESLLTHQ